MKWDIAIERLRQYTQAVGARAAAQAPRSRSAGQVIALTALMMVSLLSFAGLVVDVGIAYVQYREAQAAADAAAIAGADHLPGGQTPPTAQQIAQAISDARAVAATTNAPSGGFVDGVKNTTVDVQAPWTSSPTACSQNPYSCVKVTITRQVPTSFLNVINIGTITVQRSAVAMVQTTSGLPCVICVLNPSASASLSNVGNGNITVSNGGVVVNSTAANALSLSGNAAINAGSIGVVGGYAHSGNATTNPPVRTGVPPVQDPLAQIPYPSLSGYTSCASIFLSGNSNQTINPGCYQSISVSGNGSLFLNPGLYVITGQLSMSGNGNVSSNGGITFFATCGGSTPQLCAPGQAGGQINISGNGALNGPASGQYQGLVIFYDRNNASSINISGNGGNNLTGTIYAKSATMNISGNGGTMNANSLIVVDRIQMSGNGGIVDNFNKSQNYPNPQVGGAAKLVQ